MGLSVTIPPVDASYVVKLDAMKAYLRVDGTGDDDTVADLMSEAQEFIESETQQQMFTATKLLTLDAFPGRLVHRDQVSAGIYTPFSATSFCGQYGDREIRLPTPPLQSVSGVTYIYQGQTLTLSPSIYTVDAIGKPGRIVLNGGQTWPDTDIVANAVQVTFVCGYGTLGSAVPRRFATAAKWLVGHLWEHREAVTELNLSALPMGFQGLIEGLMFREACGA